MTALPSETGIPNLFYRPSGPKPPPESPIAHVRPLVHEPKDVATVFCRLALNKGFIAGVYED